MSDIQPYQAPLPDKIQHAKALADSGMIPRVYQGAPANVLVAIELGEALGIKPIVAINEINVINGTPSPSASLMVSLARAAGHKVRVRNDESGAGVCEIIRADDPEYTHRSVWDEKKARAAGLWGKGHWGKDPATMLRWRAASECVRLACSEVLGGLKYTPEEVMEMEGRPRTDRRVVTSVVAEPVAEAAPAVDRPKPSIPLDLADKITVSDDTEWLAKSRNYLQRFADVDPEGVADHEALIDARLEQLATPVEENADEQTELDVEVEAEAVSA